MRVLLGGGGTGGHVYPSLAVLEALRQPPHNLGATDVLYVGSGTRAEAQLAPRAGVAFQPVATGAVVERGPLALVGSALRNLQGVVQTLGIIGRFKPDVVFVTGGYISVPVVLAAALRHVPSVVCLPDARAGMAVRFLARFADRITVSAVSAAAAFPPSKAVVTGYPVRAEFGRLDRQAARARLGLGDSDKLLLVMGGSLGARGINRAIAGQLTELLRLCPIIQVSGPQDEPWLRDLAAGLPPELAARYHLHAYLHEGVADTMAAADLAVCRSGASVMGELPAAALPAVLVPYPHAGEHQRANAEVLSGAGGALLLGEADIDRLPSLLGELLGDERRLAGMREALRGLARPNAAAAIADLLAALAAGRTTTATEVAAR